LRVLMVIMWAALAVPGISAAESSPEEQITATILDGVEGWNAGDLEAFMNSYWQSDQLRFASGGKVSFGWQKVLDGYKKRYPDKAAMGHLTFSDLDVTLLGEDRAMVFGRWRLDREKDTPQGLFTLILRLLPEGWRIVHDHTSSK
jgi:ketosteroid isomerase-like protein